MDRSVAIVGAGNVGSTAAYAIFLQNIAEKISLINIRHGEKAKGEVLDLVHGAPFLHRASLLFGSDLSMCEDAEVIVLCIGEKSLLNSKTNPNQSRLGLTDINAKLFREIIPRIVSHNRDAVYLVVTNPVDVLTYLTLKLSGLPWQRVIGTGTSLDSARFKYYLGEKMGVHPSEMNAYILGEHGDSQFPVLSDASVGGMKLNETTECSPEAINECFEKTKRAAYEIVARKQATYYAIGLVISRIVDCICSDERNIIPLSVYLDDYYGESNICMSVPCLLGKGGIIRRFHLSLTKEEETKLHFSAEVLRNAVSHAGM